MSNAFLDTVTVVFTLLLFVGTSYNGHVTLGTNLFGKNPFAFYFTGACGIISTIIFSVLVLFVKTKNVLKKMVNYVQWVGRNSLYFMAIHVPIKGFLVVVVAKFLGLDSPRLVQMNMTYSLFAFVLTLIVSSIIVVFINKWIFLNLKLL